MNKNTAPFLRDSNRIQSYTLDLENYCTKFNELIKQLRDNKLIVTLTDQIMKDLAQNVTGSLKDQLREKYEADAASITLAFARQRFLDGLLDAYIQIDKIVSDYHEEIYKNRLALQLTLSDNDRTQYLTLKDQIVCFDRARLIEENTLYLSGNYTQDFIGRAKLLFQQLADFDREVRLISKGFLQGITTESGTRHKEALITCDDLGKIYLDWRLLPFLDFDHAEELLSTDQQFDNKEICGKLEI